MKRTTFIGLLIVFAVIILTACNLPRRNIPQTGSVSEPEATFTALAGTIESMLTQTALAGGVQPTAGMTIVPDVPQPTATATVPAGNPTASVPCDLAAFIADVTIPDGTVLTPSTTFVKVWRLQNIGSCTWTTNYTVVFDSGNSFSGPVSFNLPGNVAPGQMIDLAITLRAPAAEGVYRGNWRLRNAYGVPFGTGSGQTEPIWTQIRVSVPTRTFTPTRTITPTRTVTVTRTPTRTNTTPPTLTPTATQTLTPSQTPTQTQTPTVTETPPTQTATPTQTPTSTATNTPTPTSTVAGEVLRFDFVEQACTADWSSGAGDLPCPGTTGDSKGFVVRLTDPALETGPTTQTTAIKTHPEWIEDGTVEGIYPAFAVADGDHFKATIACEAGANECDAQFYLQYRTGGGEWQNLSPAEGWRETFDNNARTIDLNLSSLAGQSVQFRLFVSANGSSSQDWAVWANPRIVR